MKYWLLKSEPDEFGIDDLKTSPDQTTSWEGVRNYQARNFMRNEMSRGDRAFFYHSSCAVPGIAGIVQIATEAYPDPSQFDSRSKYYDASSSPDDPRWMLVDVRLERVFERLITLKKLRNYAADRLNGLPLLRRGNRLSVLPVSPAQWRFILTLERTN